MNRRGSEEKGGAGKPRNAGRKEAPEHETREGAIYRHEPVMVEEVLETLRPERGGWYLDGTVGGGAHARAVLEQSPEAKVVGVDRDPAAVEASRRRLAEFGERVRIVRGDFRNADELLAGSGAAAGLAGALLDLGVSSQQIDESARGFSFRLGTPLDMRMGGTPSGRGPAADFLNRASERELGRVFREYGDERRWRALARAVVRRRDEAPLRLSDDLIEAMEDAYGRSPTPQDKARVFQAVRIEVNDELGALSEGLERIREMLSPGGRLVTITYHSAEDRIVKRAFREWSRACVCPPRIPVCRCRGRPLGRPVTDGPLSPAEEEVERNPRSRSAKLRGWEKTVPGKERA